jgi:thiol-disulfide isomerase/thioredoxin
LKSAAFLSEEAISIGGKTTDGFVIRYAGEDFKVQHAAMTRESTGWIDKSRRVIVKVVDREEPLSDRVVNGRLPGTMESTTVYPVVELDQQEPASSFTFVAPNEARWVEEFSSPYAAGPRLDFIGKPAPELRLKSADGKTTALSSLRGRPVFLDFWASWCGPCKGLVPELLKLYDETGEKGLGWVGIDNDENPDAAARFISQHHLPWPNYDDVDGSLGTAFQRPVIQLGVLIDARGNIAFYQRGYEVADLRSAIAKLGPEFSSVAAAGRNPAGQSSK